MNATIKASPDGVAGQTLDPAVPIVRKLVKDSALPLTKRKTALVILSVWRAKRWSVPPKSAKLLWMATGVAGRHGVLAVQDAITERE